MASTRVQGVADLKRALGELPGKVERKAIRGAIRQGAELLRKSAVALAPIRTEGTRSGGVVQRPGSLRRNIQKKKLRQKRGRVAYIIGVETGKVITLKGTGKVAFQSRGRLRTRKATKRERRGDDPFYYRFVELGFTHRGGGAVPPRSFLKRALDRDDKRAEALIESSLRRFVAEYKP
jgi:HK97 gp10 family phage protein